MSSSYQDFGTPPAYKDITPDRPLSTAASLVGGAAPAPSSAFLSSLAAVAPPPPMLLELIKRQALAFPAKPLYTFHEDGVTASRVLTYEDLEGRTRALATELLCRTSGSGAAPVLRRGDRAMLIFLPSLDFILAFLACLRAGIVPVPCYPPDPRNLRVNVALFASVCASCGAKVALTHSAYSSLVSLASMKENALRWLGLGSGPAAAQWPELAWWDVEEATAAGRKRASGSSPTPLDVSAPADLAFLQYTSGSTSEPKGVRITHANISHNLATIVASLGAGPDTVVASWLPQYHDMGLIGSYLGVLACGGSGYYMSPLSFLKAPLSWLHMVSRARATHIQAPNFAYALLARRWRDLPAAERVKQAGSLSLTSLRHAFNAAETVTAAALTDFSAAFAPLGFSPAAFAPGYGLAENTVYVCDGGTAVVYLDREVLESSGRAEVLSSCAITALHEGGGKAALEAAVAAAGPGKRIGSFVSCGPVSTPVGLAPAPSAPGGAPRPPCQKNADVWVLVVAPATCMPCMVEGSVGEVWVASPSKADGYEGKPDASRAAFGARLVTVPAASAAGASSGPGAHLPSISSPLSSPAAAAAAGGGAGAGLPLETPPPSRTSGAVLYPFSSPRSSAGEAEAALGSPLAALNPTVPDAPPLSPPSAAQLDLAPSTAWLRTGDMGFIWRGELFLCSRIKDLIITRGRNLYPQDIEGAVEAGVGGGAGALQAAPAPTAAAAAAAATAVTAAQPLLRPGATAVFTVPSSEFSKKGDGAAVAVGAAAGSEQGEGASEDALVVVAEVRDGVSAGLLGPAVASIRSICARDFGVRPVGVLLLRSRCTRKTTSGKVARSHNAAAYLGRLRGGAVSEKNPWGLGTTAVLLEWRAESLGEGGGEVEGGAAVGSGALAPTSAAPSLAQQQPSAAAPAPAPAGGAYRTLEGSALELQLKRDIAGMLGESAWQDLPTTQSLLELGLDSLSLAQLPPRINAEYGFHVGDPQVFSPAFTVAWLVSNAPALRAGPVELPVAPPAPAVAGAAAGAAGSGATAATAATAANPQGVSGAAAPLGAAHGTPGATTRRSRQAVQPSAFETNCPCFLLCWN